ncbi:MAG: nuclease-related domain-containing protein [Chloroflexota bacterium]
MRVVTNEALIKRSRKWATRLFFLSLGILALGFFVANGQLFGLIPDEAITPELYGLVMPLVLLIGFIATLTSVRMTNLWIRVPRPEKAIQDGLKGISNKSALYNYYHFPARHVLITPQGVFPIVTRFQDGKFAVKGTEKGDRWRTFKGPIGALFTLIRLDGIGNPSRDAEQAKAYVRYLTEDYDSTIPIYPIVVFVDPKAKLLEIDNPNVPVVFADSKSEPNLKDFIKSKEDAAQFKGEGIKEFIEEWEEATLD